MESLTAALPSVTGSGSGNGLTARRPASRLEDDYAGSARRLSGTLGVARPVGSRYPVPVVGRPRILPESRWCDSQRDGTPHGPAVGWSPAGEPGHLQRPGPSRSADPSASAT